MVDYNNYSSDVLSDTAKRNLKLAEYMDAEVQDWYPPATDYKMSGLHVQYRNHDKAPFPENKTYHCADLLKYHKSWDWLMPVWKKLNTQFIALVKDDESTLQRMDLGPLGPWYRSVLDAMARVDLENMIELISLGIDYHNLYLKTKDDE